jgi:hypothetical protein
MDTCPAETTGVMSAEVRCTVRKLYSQCIFCKQNPGCSPIEWSLKRSWVSHYFSLFGLIWSAYKFWKEVERSKSFCWGYSYETFTVAPAEWNLKSFEVLNFYNLSSWINQYTVCENGLNSWKVIVRANFLWKFPDCSLEWNLRFLCSIIIQL